jgi:Holliday junction resolvase RusA-like endonuclease
MTEVLRVELPMPPSVNKLYYVRNGRKALSSEGRALKEQMRAAIVLLCAASAATSQIENVPLQLSLEFYFPEIENRGWSQNKTQTRYKKVDVSNRVKLVEDAIVEALGIDDSAFMRIHLSKHGGPTRVVAIVKRLE